MRESDIGPKYHLTVYIHEDISEGEIFFKNNDVEVKLTFLL